MKRSGSMFKVGWKLATCGALAALGVAWGGCGDQSNGQPSGTAPATQVRGTAFRKTQVAGPAVKQDGDAADTIADAIKQPDVIPAAAIAAAPNPGADKKAPGTPDKDKPDYLRVSFNELASFDYDAFDADVPQENAGDGNALAATNGDGADSTNGHEKNAEKHDAAASVKRRPNWQIPEPILALHGKKVVIQGFMVPIEIRKDEVKSFLLVRNQMMCCFGVMVGFNEWIFVQMEGEKRAKFVPDALVSVYGKMEVGEDIQNGLVMSIYRLEGHDTVFKSGY